MIRRAIAAFVFGLTMLTALGCEDAPIAKLDTVTARLKEVRANGDFQYAMPEFEKAERTHSEARQEIGRQKGRLPFLRDFAQADSLLEVSLALCREGEKTAQERRHQFLAEATETYDILMDGLRESRAILDNSLRLYEAEQHWHHGEMLLSTASDLIKREEYVDALNALGQAGRSLRSVHSAIDRRADDEQEKISMWRQWVDETVNESRRSKSVAIVVDKSQHRLFMLREGAIVAEYVCDLGFNSAYQKHSAGDGATPEGKYRVTVKKERGSKYYKALLLDFPNQRDRRRFAQSVEAGRLPAGARIGGLIEIHGHGGRNLDWTDGCVALADNDMDDVMRLAQVGTPVTIVRKSDRWP